MEQTVVLKQIGALTVAPCACLLDNQIEHRLRVAGRGRHRLQHIDRRCLMRDPFVMVAVALSQRSVALAEFPPQLRVGALKFDDHVVSRRSHVPPLADGGPLRLHF